MVGQDPSLNFQKSWLTPEGAPIAERVIQRPAPGNGEEPISTPLHLTVPRVTRWVAAIAIGLITRFVKTRMATSMRAGQKNRRRMRHTVSEMKSGERQVELSILIMGLWRRRGRNYPIVSK
jgi:hypothetical protein